jgi:hypothetical protein
VPRIHLKLNDHWWLAGDIIETLLRSYFSAIASIGFGVMGASMFEVVIGFSLLLLPSVLTVAWLVWRAS